MTTMSKTMGISGPTLSKWTIRNFIDSFILVKA